VPALFDTGALELLRRRQRRVEDLALKLFPPVICPQIVGEYLYGPFYHGVDDLALVAARLYLAPFEVLPVSPLTADLCAQIRARQAAAGAPVAESLCWIAAHALEHGLPVVTTDRQFRRVTGLQLKVVVPHRNGPIQEKRRPALAGRL
jgi:predicted nucleic acid-binding protein